MATKKKTIQHDAIVTHFAERLRQLRLERGMSQAELAQQAQVTTNYISRLERSGAAAGIDLAARLASALGVPVAELLPTSPVQDELVVMRQQVKKMCDELVKTGDRAVLLVLTQVLARLTEATNR